MATVKFVCTHLESHQSAASLPSVSTQDFIGCFFFTRPHMQPVAHGLMGYASHPYVYVNQVYNIFRPVFY